MGDTQHSPVKYDKSLLAAEDSQKHKKWWYLPGMPAVEFVGKLSSCDAYFLSIENNTDIPIISVWTISWLIFGLKHV